LLEKKIDKKSVSQDSGEQVRIQASRQLNLDGSAQLNAAYQHHKVVLDSKLQELNNLSNPVDVFRELSALLKNNVLEGLDADIVIEVKQAIRDIISMKAFAVQDFETLQLVIYNIHEILQHPLLRDELETFCRPLLIQLIEKLAREELAMNSLRFIEQNFDILEPQVTKEVLPEILNPLLIRQAPEQHESIRKLVDRLTFLLSYIADSEQALIEDLKAKKAEARALLQAIKGAVIRPQGFKAPLHTNSAYLLIIAFVLLLAFFAWLFLSV
jgi:hypothetical protein